MAKKINRGQTLTELVKGSLEYTMDWIRSQFRNQFPWLEDGPNFHVIDTFADFVVVESWSANSPLMPSEFFKVTYTKSGDQYTFAPRDGWEVVELAYQPAVRAKDVAEAKPSPKGKSGKARGKRFEETIVNSLQLMESNETENAEGPWRVRGVGITADIINGNGRRYPAKVLEAAIKELNGHLHESAGQGRMLSLTGESDHPADKGNRRPLLSEVVINWDKVGFDGQQVLIEGNLLGTSKGKDIRAQMQGGVVPGISQRGYGTSKVKKENGVDVEEVQQLIITGYDMTPPNEQSDPNGSIHYFESQSSEEDDMNLLEELKKLLAEHPELFGNNMTEAQLAKMSEDALRKMDEAIRAKLNIGADADIAKALDSLSEKARKYDDAEKKGSIEKAITEATKELHYGEEGNKMFVEAVKEANPQDADAVKSLVASKRKEYDKLFSGRKLESMGFNGKIQSVKPVLEAELGIPDYARASFELAEAYRLRHGLTRPNLKDPVTPNEKYTKMVLERFDKVYKHYSDQNNIQRGLLTESKIFEEAELTTDLNLPTSVSRAIFDIVGPTLVGASIFDVGVIEQSPIRMNFKRFSGESGYSGTMTDEEITAVLGEWVSLTVGRLTPGSVVVTTDPAATTYVEGTDYVVDYAAGRIKALASGSISDDEDLLVDATYKAIRRGEMSPIERAKVTIDSMIVTAAADRLADQISREAIVFGRSQLGFDTVTETMAALIQETRRLIDEGLLYAAYSAVKAVENNSTDPWTVGTSQDSLDELVRLMGAAGIIIDDRYYPADFYLASNVNAERLSHWDGYKRDGFPNAVLNAAGFAGGVNNKPIFASTEFPDDLIIAGNRQLVMHRVFQPMIIKGPYPSYATDGDVSRLVAADQYYTEEFNVTESPINEKGAFVPIEEAGS